MMLARISDVLLITTTHVQESFQCLLGVSSAWSMTSVYFLQMSLRDHDRAIWHVCFGIGDDVGAVVWWYFGSRIENKRALC